MKRFLLPLLIVGLTITLSACVKSTAPAAVKLSPSSATVKPGASTSFTATVTGLSASDLKWVAPKGSLGSKGADAVFVAPVVGGTYTVTVQDAKDASIKATAQVTVTTSKPTSTTTSAVPTTGGTVTGAGGASVTFGNGVLTQGTNVGLDTYDTPPAVYQSGVTAAGERVVVTLQSAALPKSGSFSIHVPASGVATSATNTLAEISVRLPNNTDASTLDAYLPDSSAHSTVPVDVAWLQAVFAPDPLPGTLTITVQPIAVAPGSVAQVLSAQGLTTQSSTTTGLYTFNASFDPNNLSAPCDTSPGFQDHQYLPAGVVLQNTKATTKKTPLVLVHGWQTLAHYISWKNEILAGVGSGVQNALRSLVREQPIPSKGSGSAHTYEPGVCGWAEFIKEYYANAALKSHFQLYTFQYDSDTAIAGNGATLAQDIETAFAGRTDVVLMGHSMGGLVINDAMHRTGGINPLVQGVITLGTPFRGSPVLQCLIAGTNHCLYAKVSPTILNQANPFNDFLGLAALQTGTRDLSWDTAVPFLWGHSVPNPYLTKFESAGSEALYNKYQAFYGDIIAKPATGAAASFLNKTAAGIWTLGYHSDGIVPIQSATFAVSSPAIKKIQTTYAKPGLDHIDLHLKANFQDGSNGVPGMDSALLKYAKASSGWTDNFESDAVGSFPKGWIANANAATDPADNKIIKDPTQSTNQVLQLYGTQPGNWSALAFRKCQLTPSFEARARIYVRDYYIDSAGVVALAMKTGPDWTYPGRWLVHFGTDGSVQLGSTVVTQYNYNRWYNVRVGYKRSGSTATITLWLDGKQYGPVNQTITNLSTEQAMDYLDFDLRGSVLVDDVQCTPNASF